MIPIMYTDKNKPVSINIRQLFRMRLKEHYKTVCSAIHTILKYWIIYLYAIIGLIAGIVLVITIVNSEEVFIQKEIYLIYFSVIIFLISTQFSIKYFLLPADRIHFKQRKDLILTLRKYAVMHTIFYQAVSWLFMFLLISPLYFYLSTHSVVHYIYLYFFCVSFTLAISMIRKESQLDLRQKNRILYIIIYLLLIFIFLIWFITIFCFADPMFILIGVIINTFIFLYSFKWGTHIVIANLKHLVQYDNRKNMLSATIVGYLSTQNYYIRSIRPTPLILCNHFIKGGQQKFVLPNILLKHLLRTASYIIMMTYLYGVSVIALFLIDHLYQFVLLAVITLYISFLIHKQHIEYFYAHTIMLSNVKQGYKKHYYDIKLSSVLTIPIIILMFIIFLYV